MKLNEIKDLSLPEWRDELNALKKSIRNGRLTMDGSYLPPRAVPVSFNNLHLISLEGSPIETGGDFHCSGNSLSDLYGGPKKVGAEYYCGWNGLSSFEGIAPIIGGGVHAESNQISNLKDIHKMIKEMNGHFDLTANPVESHILGLVKIPGVKVCSFSNPKLAAIMNKYLPLGDMFDCQEELIENGYEEYAQL